VTSVRSMQKAHPASPGFTSTIVPGQASPAGAQKSGPPSTEPPSGSSASEGEASSELAPSPLKATLPSPSTSSQDAATAGIEASARSIATATRNLRRIFPSAIPRYSGHFPRSVGAQQRNPIEGVLVVA
jgi:hypothetical protein